MQTNASFVRITLVAVAGMLAAACAGPSMGPTEQPQQPGAADGTGGNGGATGSGGNGGATGAGGGGATGAGGSGGSAPDGGTTTPPGDGGTITASLGCAGYVACLDKAMSDADATACDNMATMNAQNLLGAADDCVGNYCLGMSGAAARCKQGTDGSMENLDGTAAFDATTGAPTGDCGACLLNGDAGPVRRGLPADDRCRVQHLGLRAADRGLSGRQVALARAPGQVALLTLPWESNHRIGAANPRARRRRCAQMRGILTVSIWPRF